MRASKLFRTECNKLPQHNMHVHARMVVCLYLARYKGYTRHKARIAKALHSLDKVGM